ncbi:MAG: hypothetical protein KAT74_10895, partial [Candidatus Cloacimonetes bacterium]|nr:hypothetical protein [Candidatus Cloacimonadota bacterium]
QTKYLIYNLYDTYNGVSFQYGLSSIIGKYVFCKLYAEDIKNFDMPSQPKVDDNYLVGNADLTVNLSNKFSLTNGLRYNNYKGYIKVNNEYDYYKRHLGIFSNFRWEFKENCDFYIGLKYSRDTINKIYTDKNDFKLNQAYIKFSYTF